MGERAVCVVTRQELSWLCMGPVAAFMLRPVLTGLKNNIIYDKRTYFSNLGL